MSDTVAEETSAPKRSLGLYSSTTLVVGSMVGSGVFIVSADMSRVVQSPSLLIAAWLVTAALTIVGALSYGELAAMMPEAGGQYIYLREALGPIWGFLYGWTLFLVIQTGTIAAVSVAFGKFLGVFLPSISSTHWIWHLAHIPQIHIGSVTLGNIEVGLNTANLIAIAVVGLLTLINIGGVKVGAAIQNVFTTAKSLALLALVIVGLTIGRNAVALASNFGPSWHNFWSGSTGARPVQPGGVMVGVLTILAVVQVGSLFSSDAWNNVTFTAGEIKILAETFHYPCCLELASSCWSTSLQTSHSFPSFHYSARLPERHRWSEVSSLPKRTGSPRLCCNRSSQATANF